MSFGVLVTIDKSKYNDYKAVFLPKVASMDDILVHNPDISTYFAFETAKEAQIWLNEWVLENRSYTHIPLEYFEIVEILPGINTKGYLPGTNMYRTNLLF